MSVLRVFVLVVLLASAALGCQAPLPIFGRTVIAAGPVLVPVRARVELLLEGFVIDTAESGPFGYYRFDPVLPCSPYTLRAYRKQVRFAEEVIMPKDFTCEGARRDIVGSLPGFWSAALRPRPDILSSGVCSHAAK